MTDEWTRAEKRKAQSEQAKAIMDFVSMLSDKINKLEKENAELEKRLVFTRAEFQRQYKENAELKEELKDANEKVVHLACNQNKDLKYKLTKAKEHIRTLISCLIDWVQEGDKDYCYIADAEQFLKEIEK